MWNKVNQRIGQAMANIRQVFRAVTSATDSTTKVQQLQLQGLKPENLDGAEYFQHYGLTSNPPAGCMAIVVPLNGETSHSVVVATEHGAYRIKSLKPGEVAIYTDEGDSLTFKRDNIVELKTKQFLVDAEDLIQMTTKKMQFTASESAQIDTPKLTANATAYTQTSTTATFNCDTTAFNGQNWSVTAATAAQINAATIDLIAANRIDQTAPEIGLNGNLTVSDVSGAGVGQANIRGNVSIDGTQDITGTSTAMDHISGGHSGATHQHPYDDGTTGTPI